MIRETLLEAGEAIGVEPSCFKASSGNHLRSMTTWNRSLLYAVAPSMQAISLVHVP